MFQALCALSFLTVEPPVDLSRLSSPVAAERVAALDAIRALPGQHRDLVEPVANALEDGAPEVRSAAAYALTQLMVRLGCLPSDITACKLFLNVLDNTPVRETKKLRIDYPEAAKRAGFQGVATIQFLVREDGTVGELKAVRGERIFTDPLIKELEGQRYKPARRKGRPVPFAYLFQATYKLSP